MLGRSNLRSLVDGLGSIAANPTLALRYKDKSQRFSINLQGGLQRLKGNQVEQLVRYRDPDRPEESRQDNQQLVVRSLLRSWPCRNSWANLQICSNHSTTRGCHQLEPARNPEPAGGWPRSGRERAIHQPAPGTGTRTGTGTGTQQQPEHQTEPARDQQQRP